MPYSRTLQYGVYFSPQYYTRYALKAVVEGELASLALQRQLQPPRVTKVLLLGGYMQYLFVAAAVSRPVLRFYYALIE